MAELTCLKLAGQLFFIKENKSSKGRKLFALPLRVGPNQFPQDNETEIPHFKKLTP